MTDPGAPGGGRADGSAPFLVALDVDGTILSWDEEPPHDEHISPAVRSAVAAVLAGGHHVVISTGRTVLSTLHVARELGLETGWLVCSNGAVTARLDASVPAGFVVEEQVTFDPGPAVRLVLGGIPDVYVAVEDLGQGHRVNRAWPEGEIWGEQTVVDVDDLGRHPVTRVVVRSPERTREDFHELVEQLGLEDVTYAIGWTAWMDVAPQGVTKATALEQVRRRLGVEPWATVAVGDGRNDVGMLEWAARGVAMGHADDVVKAAADEVTGSVHEDGLARALERLLG
ncbi:HAD family hydrolase [Luteimicrobium subarcticum]|uniref:Hydroxymethylpyrimidine pyrophosphatase-like HAD family hydrolase n=1 Tax=Luteimicrobium subarcticum TaxID=620910 RepID=A0A2M8W738_9MICO|nr:HAD family hydrolase [Luteimicrobium subarcticum]PJI86743.1 hydroxymethylpyrimidine pyrophosphatase-like HAD family hydrolase [Luteimicrobium subarcticum]